MLQTFFYLKSSQWEIGHSHWTPRAFEGDTLRSLQGHSKSTWSLGHLMHSGTWALKALGHLGTRALEGHLDTQALGHSKHSRHFIYMTRENSGSCFYLTFPDVKSIREYEKGSKNILPFFSCF